SRPPSAGLVSELPSPAACTTRPRQLVSPSSCFNTSRSIRWPCRSGDGRDTAPFGPHGKPGQPARSAKGLLKASGGLFGRAQESGEHRLQDLDAGGWVQRVGAQALEHGQVTVND